MDGSGGSRYEKVVFKPKKVNEKLGNSRMRRK